MLHKLFDEAEYLDEQVLFSWFSKTWQLLHRIQPKFGEIGFDITKYGGQNYSR